MRPRLSSFPKNAPHRTLSLTLSIPSMPTHTHYQSKSQRTLALARANDLITGPRRRLACSVRTRGNEEYAIISRSEFAAAGVARDDDFHADDKSAQACCVQT